MRVTYDISLTRENLMNYYDLCGKGAKDTVKYLTNEELEQVENYLEELYPDGMTDNEVNNFYWFDTDTIARVLGYENFDQIMERRNA